MRLAGKKRFGSVRGREEEEEQMRTKKKQKVRAL